MPKMSHKKTKDGHRVIVDMLMIVVEPDEDMWVAQGLEINYGACGKTPEEAVSQFCDGLSEIITAQLTAQGRVVALPGHAPWRVFERFAAGRGDARIAVLNLQIKISSAVKKTLDAAIPQRVIFGPSALAAA